jgi:hypothetical protein
MNNHPSFLECINRLTDEFRRVMTEDIRAAFTRPYHDALEAMLRIHQLNREQGFLYHLIDHPWLVPLSSFLGGIKAFSDEIEDKGVRTASAALFQKMGVRLKVILPPQIDSILMKKTPIMLVGEHPSKLGFDFFAVAASLAGFRWGKTEPRLLALPSTIGICPGLRSIAFPVVQTQHSTMQLLTSEGGQPEELAQLWVPEAKRRQSMDITSSSLDKAANHWLDGGHVVIFPDTGLKGSDWFYGIGRIVLNVLDKLKANGEADPYILFFHLEGAKDLLILNYPFMSHFHPARLMLLGKDGNITVRYHKLLRIRDYQDTFLSMDKGVLTRYLQREYELAKNSG